MKKLLLLTIMLISATISVAQNSGLGFNYQAVVRRADGFLLANKNVLLRVSLYPGQNATNPTWVELHQVQTDNSGSFGITVGKGTKSSNSLVGSFKDINFAAVYYWMKIEIQENGSYREVSFAQLPSAPYSEVSHSLAIAGAIIPFAGPADKIPAGWLLCDGREVSRSEYLNLYNAIGVCWGKGDNSKTFNLPDLRGMFLRGVSGDSGNDQDAKSRTRLTENGGNVGNDVGSYQGDAIRNITGQIGFMDVYKYTNPNTNGAFYATSGNYDGPKVSRDNDNGLIKFDASRAPGVTVGSDNRPKNVYVNYIIKY
jgi:microcystin-dependent protein